MFGSSFGRSFRLGERPLSITSASQLPNLEVWYDASQSISTTFNSNVITSGTEVTSWHNGGGLTSHDWNSTGGKRPEWFSNIQNGKGVVRFNNTTTGTPTGEDADTDELLSINPIAYLQSLPAATMVLLYRTLSTAAGRRILTSSNTSGFQWGQNGTQYVGGFSGATFTVDSITVDTNFHHIILRFDGSQSTNATRLTARLDSSELSLTFSGTVGATTSPSASSFYGGVDSTGNSNYFIGDIGEIMIFTRALSFSEIFAIEQYLTNKWAV
jgi:hypothetical protein